MASTTDRPDLERQLASYRHGRVPQSLRRRQLLLEARTLFTERGYAHASMDELARRMGVSKPVVYQLAGSKEQLFRDVIATVHRELTDRIAAAVAPEADLRNKLSAGVTAFLCFVKENREGWNTLLSMQAGPAGADMAALRQGQVLAVVELLARDLEDRGAAVDARSIEICVIAINGAIEAAALWWQSHAELSSGQLARVLTELLAPGLLTLAKAGALDSDAVDQAGSGRRERRPR